MKYGITINAFDAGLNTKVSPLQGSPNESPDLQNVVFDDVGAVSTRLGYSAVNSVALDAAPDLLHSFISEDTEPQLLAIYGSIYKLSNTSQFSIVTGTTDIFSTGVDVYGINTNNKCYLSNGSDKYKYDGTDTTLWGCPVPTTAAMTSIVSGASTLAGSAYAGEYYYRIAYINDANVESPASSEKTFVVSTTCNAVNVQFDTVAASSGVEYFAVYRNDYLLEVASASTAYIVDTHEELTSARDETIIDKRPPAVVVFIEHGGYVFGAIDESSELYYSEINQPDAWDPSSLIRVGYGDGKFIRALAIYNDGLIICKEDGEGNGAIYVLYMPDSVPENWSLQKLDLAYGGISKKAIANYEAYLMVLNKGGVYNVSSTQIGVLSTDPISYPIDPDIKLLSNDFLPGTVAKVFENKIWISVPRSASTNNRIYQYDFVRGRNETGKGSWSRFSNMTFKDMTVHSGELYSADYSGYIYQLDTGRNDNGTAIDAYYKTMHIHGLEEHRSNTKVWRYLYVTVEAVGDWDLTVEWNGNYSTVAEGSYDIDLDAGGSIWGTAVWGVSTWGGTRAQKTVRIPLGLVAKSIQLTFKNSNLNEYFKVYSVDLHYSLRGAR